MGAQYETDFVAWSERQVELLHNHRFELEPLGIDVTNLVDEVATLGRTERRRLRSRMVVLLVHLLKWQFQSMRQSNSWRLTIEEQRERVDQVLRESPSLRRSLDAALKDAYGSARRRAAIETSFNIDTFPAACPWRVSQVLDVNFLP
jgi:Domain of unknown function DUF29